MSVLNKATAASYRDALLKAGVAFEAPRFVLEIAVDAASDKGNPARRLLHQDVIRCGVFEITGGRYMLILPPDPTIVAAVRQLLLWEAMKLDGAVKPKQVHKRDAIRSLAADLVNTMPPLWIPAKVKCRYNTGNGVRAGDLVEKDGLAFGAWSVVRQDDKKWKNVHLGTGLAAGVDMTRETAKSVAEAFERSPWPWGLVTGNGDALKDNPEWKPAFVAGLSILVKAREETATRKDQRRREKKASVEKLEAPVTPTPVAKAANRGRGQMNLFE